MTEQKKGNRCGDCGCFLPFMNFEEEVNAINEYEQNFSEFNKKEGLGDNVNKVILCEDCYQKFMEFFRQDYQNK